MPISGDLHVDGHYQLEGNAGGTITTCEPPEHLAVTWEFDGAVSWVDVYLTPSDAETVLRLEHVALVEDFDDKWDEFGPGAVGVGWDSALLGLAEHLATGEAVNPDFADPALLEFMRRSSDDGAGPRSPTAPHARKRGRGGAHHCCVHRWVMHAFDVLGDPVRRRILELLVADEMTSGEITTVVQREFGISQPAVSQHLRVLREPGSSRPRGRRRGATTPSTPRRCAGWTRG